MVLATDRENHHASSLRRVPQRAVDDGRRYSRRVFTARISFRTARQVLVRSDRSISDVLVSPFSGVHVGAQWSRDRTPHGLVARGVYGGVGCKGKRDGCHNGAGAGLLRDVCRCFGMGSHASADRCCMAPVGMLWTVRDRYGRTHRTNASIAKPGFLANAARDHKSLGIGQSAASDNLWLL